MSGSSGKAKEIVLGDELGDIAVRANGVRVEIHTDGSVVVYTKSAVDAFTNGAVHIHPAVNDDGEPAAKAAPQIGPEVGDIMPAGHPNAGWIFMGPDDVTGKDFYAASRDESGTFTFNGAATHARSIGAQVPTKSQLDKLYQHKQKDGLKGTFNETGSNPAGWYWSSLPYDNVDAWAQCFSDGYQNYHLRVVGSSLRLVR